MPNLVRWTPRNNVSRSVRSFEQMMDDLWRNAWNEQPARFSTDTTRPMLRPAMDVVENDEAVTIRVNLPGLSPDNVNVEIDGDLLTISGEIGDTVEEAGDHYHYRERYRGAFRRSLRLADTLDTENVAATFENGVLNLVLPKRPEAQPKRIKVENAS